MLLPSLLGRLEVIALSCVIAIFIRVEDNRLILFLFYFLFYFLFLDLGLEISMILYITVTHQSYIT